MGLLAFLPALAAKRWSSAGLATALTVASVYLLHRSYLLFQLLIVAKTSSIEAGAPALLAIFWTDAALVAVGIGVGSWLFRTDRTALLWVIRVMLGFLLATLAVGSAGNYQAHHFLFATPFYVAGFMRFVSVDRLTGWPVLILTAFIGLAMLLSPSRYYLERRKLAVPDVAVISASQKSAARMDLLMDSCAMRQYLPWLDHPWAMKHSPYVLYHAIVRGFQPAFNNPPNPIFRKAYMDALQLTKLFARTSEVPIMEEIQEILDTQFTRTPPPCAAPFVGEIPYELYFRT